MISSKDRQYLISLARRSILYFLTQRRYLKVNQSELPSKNLAVEQGTFVTLTVDGNLRGCIGHIEPIYPIYKDIIENAVSAAFFDPRFDPLSAGELPEIKIEISLLSVPQKLKYETPDELLMILREKKPGVIIKKGFNKATFLPQVWEELPGAEEFLIELCLKAGLSSDSWKSTKLEVLTYTAEIFHE